MGIRELRLGNVDRGSGIRNGDQGTTGIWGIEDRYVRWECRTEVYVRSVLNPFDSTAPMMDPFWRNCRGMYGYRHRAASIVIPCMAKTPVAIQRSSAGNTVALWLSASAATHRIENSPAGHQPRMCVRHPLATESKAGSPLALHGRQWKRPSAPSPSRHSAGSAPSVNRVSGEEQRRSIVRQHSSRRWRDSRKHQPARSSRPFRPRSLMH